jgi:integrase
VRRGKAELPADSEQVAFLQAQNDALRRDHDQLLQKIELLEREVQSLRGKKYRRSAAPTLRDTVDKWLATWKAEKRDRNPEYVKTVTWDLERFTRQFGEKTTIDKLDGAEDRINTWLNSLQVPVERDEDGKVLKSKPISPSRLRQVRIYLLKMLTESGCELNRKRVLRPSNKELKESRGGIRWLTKEQAQAMMKLLPAPFADAFRIQVAIGLRPNELLTLHASHFERDFSILHLQRLGSLRLKTGPRTIPIPEDVRPTLRWRAQQNDVLFPHMETGKPYSDPKEFTSKFKGALSTAATKARIRVPMDSRIGRRTCASLLIQANVSAEKVADLLGNSAAMILDHYGDPNTKNLFNSLTGSPTTFADSAVS